MSLRSLISSFFSDTSALSSALGESSSTSLQQQLQALESGHFDRYHRFDRDDDFYLSFSSSSHSESSFSTSYDDSHRSAFNSPSSLDSSFGTGSTFGINGW